MAISSTAEKLSAMNLGASGGAVALPSVGASVDVRDRRHMLGLYIGDAADAAPTAVGMGFGTGVISSGARRPGRK